MSGKISQPSLTCVGGRAIREGLPRGNRREKEMCRAVSGFSTALLPPRGKIANHERGRRRSFLALAYLALVGIATWSLSLPSPAAAQAAAADPALAGLQIWNTHNCSMCHSGMGTGTRGEFAAPNLRESSLKPAEIRETVACGRGPMPTHLMGARSEERRVGKECRSRWSPYH